MGTGPLLQEMLWRGARASSPFSFQGMRRGSQGARLPNRESMCFAPGARGFCPALLPLAPTLCPSAWERQPSRSVQPRSTVSRRFVTDLPQRPPQIKLFFSPLSFKIKITNALGYIIKKKIFLTGKDSRGLKPADDGSSTVAPASSASATALPAPAPSLSEATGVMSAAI